MILKPKPNINDAFTTGQPTIKQIPLSPEQSLIRHFRAVDDPRIERSKRHLLIDIIVITLLAVICGANGWVGVATFGQAKQHWLKTFLALPNGIPSHDTFGEVFARINPEQMQQCFLNWVRSVSRLPQGEVIAIDGKTLRRSYDTADNKGAIHMVSAWASQNRLVLGQRKVDEKSNEITAIPELLKVLSIEGCVITIDAMGTQTAIARQIIAQKGDYVLALKGNQGDLFTDVQQLFAHAEATDFNGIDYDDHEQVDAAHGRIETRRYWTMGCVEGILNAEKWDGLTSLVMVESIRRESGQPAPKAERRYFISSLAPNAPELANAIRSHWGIENSLHWVLDIAFREDECRIRKGHSDENMALIRHVALSLLNQETTAKVGIQNKRLRAGWDNDYLLKVILG